MTWNTLLYIARQRMLLSFQKYRLPKVRYTIISICFPGMTKLLVATGLASKNLRYSSSVEIVNLDESNPDLICDNLPNLPVSVRSATGKLLNRNRPTICGGSAGTAHCECHSFEEGRCGHRCAWMDIKGEGERERKRKIKIGRGRERERERKQKKERNRN